MAIDSFLVVDGECLGVDNGSFGDFDAFLADFEIVVLNGHPGEDAIGSGVHAETLHDDSLEVVAILKIIVGQFGNVLNIALDILPQFLLHFRIGDDVVNGHL